MASVAYFNLSHPVSAAYTESWMSDHDVKTYAQQAGRAPVAASNAIAAKPGRHTAHAKPTAPAAAHADVKLVSKAHAAPATGNAQKVQHAAGAAAKVHVAAKPSATQLARASTTVQH